MNNDPKRSRLIDYLLAVVLGLLAYGSLVEWGDEPAVHFTAWAEK
jgi:hypothetical protein